MPIHPLADTVVWTVDTIKCALVTSDHAYTGNELYWSEMAGDEVSGTGYTADGQAIANPVRTWDSVNRRRGYDCDDITWATASLSDVKYATFYKVTGDPDTSPILGTYVFDVAESPSLQDLIVQISDAGVYTNRDISSYEA